MSDDNVNAKQIEELLGEITEEFRRVALQRIKRELQQALLRMVSPTENESATDPEANRVKVKKHEVIRAFQLHTGMTSPSPATYLRLECECGWKGSFSAGTSVGTVLNHVTNHSPDIHTKAGPVD